METPLGRRDQRDPAAGGTGLSSHGAQRRALQAGPTRGNAVGEQRCLRERATGLLPSQRAQKRLLPAGTTLESLFHFVCQDTHLPTGSKYVKL